MLRQGLPIMLALLLAGCNSASVQPDSSTAGAPVQPAGQADSSAPTEQAGQGETPAPHDAGLEQLSNRLTLVQEQLIQLRAQGAELSQQSQQVLARLQMLTGPDAEPEAEDVAPEAASDRVPSGELEGLIDRLSMVANELSASGVGDAYRVVATYTATREWILIRYDRFSGETWIADRGAWRPFIDPEPIPASEYDVVLERAERDVKGYAVARLDRRSGDTWWLSRDTWQKFD